MHVALERVVLVERSWGRERHNVTLTLKGEKLNYLNVSSFKGRENLLFINNERLINV